MKNSATVQDDHRIANEADLQQTLDAIRLLKASVEDLRRDVGSRSQQWFELMAEGPRDEIEKLQAEVDEYLAKRDAPARRRA